MPDSVGYGALGSTARLERMSSTVPSERCRCDQVSQRSITGSQRSRWRSLGGRTAGTLDGPIQHRGCLVLLARSRRPGEVIEERLQEADIATSESFEKLELVQCLAVADGLAWRSSSSKREGWSDRRLTEQPRTGRQGRGN